MAQFTHQYDFNINLPKQVISNVKHDSVITDNLEGKVIIGLCGYGKSGKDTIAKHFIDNYGFQRIAFADNIKKEMNLYLKEAVYLDLVSKQKNYFQLEEIDFFTERPEMKPVLRPYIIWYGEKLREINGQFYWINRAFAEDAKDIQNIVLSDVRRAAELEVFKNSNEFNKRYIKNLADVGMQIPDGVYKTKNFGTLLFHVNQLNLTDGDVLTHECIRLALEQWLFDFTFYVDSRIIGDEYRKKAIDKQIKEVVEMYGMKKPKKEKNKQLNIFNQIND
jgi:hypothetical protein